MYQQQNTINQYPEECYIDQKEGILKTPCNLYNHSLKIINNVESLKSREGVTGTVIYGYMWITKDLQKALVFGIADAALPLAYLCYNSFGDKRNIDKIKLYIAVGKNLGSETCKQLINGQNNGDFDLAEFLQNNPKYSKNLLSKAERFANICKSNATNTSNDTVLYKDTVLEAFRPFLRKCLF